MDIQISGNLAGPTVVFIAGWPDTCDVFRENIMAALAPHYRIVGITLPGYDDEHPFLKDLRKRGMQGSLSCAYHPSSPDTNQQQQQQQPSASSSAFQLLNPVVWLGRVFSFSWLRRTSDAQAAQRRAITEAQHSCLINARRVACGRPPLVPFRTPWVGYNFQDLVTMLEVAVDTAMETCNYCPSAVPAAAAATAAPLRASNANFFNANTGPAAHGKARVAEESESGVPLHQLPPTYTKPVLIAHDWGCFLAFELLLRRPNLFSRFVSLDVGGYVFEGNAAHVERMCDLVSRTDQGQVATAVVDASVSGGGGVDNATAVRPASFGANGVPLPSTETTATTLEAHQTRGVPSARSRHEVAHGSQQSPDLPAGGVCHQGTPLIPPPSESVPPQQLQPLHKQDKNRKSSGDSSSQLDSQRGETSMSPVTVVHGVHTGKGENHNKAGDNGAGVAHFGSIAQQSLTSPLLPPVRGNSGSGGAPNGATKRSLASQYAIRRKKAAPQTQRADRQKIFAIASYQLFLILSFIFSPFRIAGWLVGFFARLCGRPAYYYDPQIALTPTVQLLNHSLNAEFFAQHPFALENRGALDVSALLQLQEDANLRSSFMNMSMASINLEHPSLMRSKPAVPTLLPGWKVFLIPYTEGDPLPVPHRPAPRRLRREDESSSRQASPSRLSRQRDDGENGTGNSNPATSQPSRRSSRNRRHSLYDNSPVSSSYRLDNAEALPVEDSDAEEEMVQHGAGALNDSDTTTLGATNAALPTDNVIYSSYMKGADLFEEWNTPLEGMGRVHASAGGSGELDPYVSVLAIPNPLWAGDDPLALTGAQFFQESRRGFSGACAMANEEYYLIASDADPGGRVNRSAAATNTQMRVAKRKIYYQAVVFPPLASALGNPSLLSVDNVNNDGSLQLHDDAVSSRSRSTVLDRLRRSQRNAALRPTVPVVPSPRQGWIYLRYWLDALLIQFMRLITWLLGDKKTLQPYSTNDSASNAPANVDGKAYSTVMMTALTTIYRRLPAPPSLAASTTNLPGDGDTALQPMSNSPLVSLRYFVPLPVPILFMYGGDKKVMIHADHWCTYVRQYQRPRDGISDVVEVQGGGHWFFAEKKYQKKVADRIAEFLVAEARLPPGL